MAAGPDIESLITEAAARIAAVSDSARIDAKALAKQVFGLDAAGLIRDGTRTPSARERLAFQNGVTRRLDGEPVAYIIGHCEFWSMTLDVNPDVLIPRPETELLVETALEQVSGGDRILELGTGSGAIALALASERPHAAIVATDASSAALETARANAAKLGLNQIEFRSGSWFNALPDAARFDVIVSNPPYIADDDIHLSQGDLRFEPQTALVSGADGLDDLRTITTGAATWLNPNGWLLVEHGFDQGLAVRGLMSAAGFTAVETRRDLGGLERVTLGRRTTIDD